ncbi:Zona pellucida-like domain family protein [Brugia pahangi]
MDYVVAITIDNDIIGDPDIECLDEEIRIFVKTRKIFNGRIYAKGKADNSACIKDNFAQERTTKPHMFLKFGTCGMRSLRSIDPRGMYYGITIVVSFHTLFITKVDQAFHVKCFFEEASHGLTAKFGVSMIATTEMEARHPIPGCSYSIHSSSIDDIEAGKPAGPKIKYARIGDRVLHQWHCDDQMYGILINNCYVTDGFGKRSEVIDSNGCSIDPILITGIRYSSDLQRAYGESMVFKFADRPGVWFFCQIQMCMKKEGMCSGITPPSCSSQINNNNAYGTNEIYEGQEISGRIKPFSLTLSSSSSSSTTTMKTAKNRERSKIENLESEMAINAKSIDEYSEENARNAIENEENDGIYDELEYATLAQNGLRNEEHPRIIAKQKLSTATTDKALVTTIFETTDDYNIDTRHVDKETGKQTSKKEYKETEYEDITVGSNLNDLLANLPDQVNADSLQKMFHDSVENRRALMRSYDYLINQMEENKMTKMTTKSSNIKGKYRRGDKIKTYKVFWDSVRLADKPLIAETSIIDPENPENNNNHLMAQNVDIVSSTIHDNNGLGSTMIAGQLIIYDLDEEPPVANQLKNKKRSTLAAKHSLISRYYAVSYD